MDPLLLSALFVGLAHSMTPSERAEVAWRGPLIAFVIFVAVGLGGAKLLGADMKVMIRARLAPPLP